MALDTDPRHVFRDFVTDGIPATGPHNPRKPEIRNMFADWWQTLIALVANQTGLTLPNLLIRYTVTGGDNNDIVAEADLPVPAGAGTALFSISVADANTENVTINGKRLLTSSGNELVSGGLVSGIWLFLDDGDNFRLVSDQASQAIMNAAEQAADDAFSAKQDAEAARDIVENLASDAVSQGNVPIYSTLASISSLEIPTGINAIRVNGRNAVGDGEGGLYTANDNGSADTAVSADGRTWWRVDDVGLNRLSDETKKLWRFASGKYRKSVAMSLPIRGPMYDSIVSGSGLSYLIPQAFTVDWLNGHIYLSCSGDIDIGKLWVRVHEFTTGEHIATFATECGGQSYSEGIVVKYENGVRTLYHQTGQDTLGRFEISEFPDNLTTLAPDNTFVIGLHSQFDYRNGQWIVQQRAPSVGGEMRRNNYAIYNHDITQRLGTVFFSNADCGPWTASSLVDYIPKIQTMQFGGGFYFASCGGFHSLGAEPQPYSYQGIKIFHSDGQLVDENLIDPEVLARILIAGGHTVNKIEYEGAAVSSDGRIYSLCMTLSPDHPNGDDEGILIFEEFSTQAEFMDFSPAARCYPKVDVARVSSGIWPRSPEGKIHNPWSGHELTTWDQIMDMMRAMDVPRVAYYTSATTSVVGIGAEVLPGGCLVEIISCDNQTFTVDISGFGIARKYTVYGTPGSRGIRRRSLQLNAQVGVTAAQLISGFEWRAGDQGSYIDTAAMTANGAITLLSIGAVSGDIVRVKRRGGGYILSIKNYAGDVITTMAENQIAEFIMGGADWYLWDKHNIL